MPKGAIVRGMLEDFIKDELLRRGYQPVYTPHIGRVELYQTSGHFPYYPDCQFPPIYLDPFMQSVAAALRRAVSGEVTASKFVDMFEDA